MTRPAGRLAARLVGRFPYVGQADGRVEPVEEAERRGGVLEQRPREVAVEVDAQRVLAGLVLQRLQQPGGQVAEEQHSDVLAARLGLARLGRVAAPAQAVHQERRLQEHLERLRRRRSRAPAAQRRQTGSELREEVVTGY